MKLAHAMHYRLGMCARTQLLEKFAVAEVEIRALVLGVLPAYGMRRHDLINALSLVVSYRDLMTEPEWDGDVQLLTDAAKALSRAHEVAGADL